MLGLGLAISVGKRVLGDAIDSLLSALRGRATYYENGSASKSTIKAIDDADILDKASILLTPTATSNARVHSVKTYTGDELVTNGTFDTDSNWTKGTGWSISGGIATYDGTGGTSAMAQADVIEVGKTYKVTIEVISNEGTGANTIYLGGTVLNSSHLSVGTHTFYGATSNTSVSLNIYGRSGEVFQIDNVSVVDVSSDFDFDRASSATRINSDGLVQDMQSITDPELVLNGDFEELGNQIVNISSLSGDNWTADGSGGFTNNGSGEGLSGSLDVSTIVGETYKFTFDVTISGIANATFGGVTIPTFTTSGSKEYYVTATSSSTSFSFYLAPSGSPSMFVNNVSVQQVDPNDSWTLGTGWEIINGIAVADGSVSGNNYLISTGTDSVVGHTYKVVFTVSDYVAGNVRVRAGQFASSNVNANGTYTQYQVSTSTETVRVQGSSSFEGKIDNISVKDITFSEEVDLARINYDSNGENGHILLEPTSTNLITYSEDFDEWVKGVSTTVTPNFAISPDGTQNATRLQTLTGSGTYLTLATSMTIGNDYTLTLYLKNNGGQNVDIGVAASSTVGTKTASIEVNLTNEWVRYELNFTADSNSNFVFIDNISNANSVDCLIWGVQLEELPYATSYIPTLTGSTVTRATETLTGSGNSTLINSTEGVLYAEIAALANSGTVRYMGLNDGSSDNRVIILNDGTANRIRAIVSSGGTKYVDFAYDVTDVTDFHKVAVKYKANDFALWVNGVERATDTSGSAPIGLNDLEFDLNSGGAFYGKCKALAVFNEALSDSELTNLTS